MPNRSSKASRAKDQQIHEALLSGYLPGQVARQFNLQPEQVLAADRRVQERRAKKGPEAARLEKLETELNVLARAFMREFQRGIAEPDVTVKYSSDASGAKLKGEHMTRRMRGSAPLAAVVMSALAQQRALHLRQSDSDQEAAREEDMQQARDNAKERMRLLNEHPDLYLAFVRAKDALTEAQQRGPNPVPGR